MLTVKLSLDILAQKILIYFQHAFPFLFVEMGSLKLARIVIQQEMLGVLLNARFKKIMLVKPALSEDLSVMNAETIE